MRKTILSIVTAFALTATTLSAAETFASVNGEDVTTQDVAQLLRGQNVQFENLPKETKDKVISQLIEKKLLTQKAVKSGIEKDEKYKDALSKIKEDLALELWMQKEYSKVKATDAEEKSFYDKNKEKFKTPDTLEASHILVKTEKEANDVIAKLNIAKNKKGSFEELAKKFSIGPTKTKGGYLGKFQAKQMVPEFSEAALKLKKGEYTKKPVKTQFGYHVIYLENKEISKVLPFDKVKDNIEKLIVQEKYAKIIKEEVAKLKKDAKIIIK
ncbi:peptidyl-prolyl cis-trans isomerase [Arcobacter sp. F2176]|uniref:peptidylprolyl isomerase n=1 Tax=unclassified Arcobacter TaxID=2593671 RepID=UPI00100B538B|nr:peptidyl-prolyl cis-trans isomerase [Arcobacter sp. F2176]RXJ81421.1 peptidylprolyl isomerase [Arcobacter sp. F2176]